MARSRDRIKARTLRQQGWSIRSIAEHLHTARSTTSIWCRDVQLTQVQKNNLANNSHMGGSVGRMKGAQANRDKKTACIHFYKTVGKQVIGKETDRDLLIAGIALYWAEGNKRSKFGITNSDPLMIQFAFRWLKEVMNVPEIDFSPRISINAIHRDRIDTVTKFWSELLKLPVSQFGKPVLLKNLPKKIYENHDTYYGVLALQVRRGTELRYRVQGLIEALANTPG